ncbi:MAG: hypothetical protein EOP30_08845 [Rhodococcus sp. (in: high G+C Gram-positive bacteria)]|nr:MAG: hypothetical protein EOP30_08845 [Rhodococcus sp. (in: high G+C Gram-positive bacteria)]
MTSTHACSHTQAGAGFFVCDPDGNHGLPTSFRISLRTMPHGRPDKTGRGERGRNPRAARTPPRAELAS